jgi:hypothetical protein
MSVYTVHEPPPRADEQAADPHAFVFVRDGFHFWAFLLTPVWMLWHRLWLVFVLYLILVLLVDAAALAAGAAMPAALAIGALVSLLAGLEASTLRRWTLARRGWKNVGIVIGDDSESAERRFFDSWYDTDAPSASAAPATTVSPMRVPSPTDVIGLFPQPGARH